MKNTLEINKFKGVSLPKYIDKCKYNLKGGNNSFNNAIQTFYSKCVYRPYIYEDNVYQLHHLDNNTESNIMIRHNHEIGVYRELYTNNNQGLGRLVYITVKNSDGIEIFNSENKLLEFETLEKYVVNAINIFEKLYKDFCIMYYELSDEDVNILTSKNFKIIERLQKDGEFYNFLKYRT